MDLTQVHLLHVGQQRGSIGLPEAGQLSLGGELAAGQLQGDLQTLLPHVVIVLHPTWHHRKTTSHVHKHIQTHSYTTVL